ncbi:MAG: Lrp/AsnC ligand binding domain-containing protein [Candidatus Bathyarchaeia archaeon]
MVQTQPGASEQVIKARNIRGVKLANSVFGRFDAVVIIEAKNFTDLTKIVYEMVEKTPGVLRTETMIALEGPE